MTNPAEAATRQMRVLHRIADQAADRASRRARALAEAEATIAHYTGKPLDPDTGIFAGPLTVAQQAEDFAQEHEWRRYEARMARAAPVTLWMRIWPGVMVLVALGLLLSSIWPAFAAAIS